MEREGLDKVCKYNYKTGHNVPENPHTHEVRVQKKILDDITDYVGNTPMVRLSNIAKSMGLKCELCKVFSLTLKWLNVNSSIQVVRSKIELEEEWS